MATDGCDAGGDQDDRAADEVPPGDVGDDAEDAVLVVADDAGDGKQGEGDACEQAERLRVTTGSARLRRDVTLRLAGWVRVGIGPSVDCADGTVRVGAARRPRGGSLGLSMDGCAR